MRNEQVICDTCGKRWDILDADGSRRWWETVVSLKWASSTQTDVILAAGDADEAEAEVCSECASALTWLLAMLVLAMRGDREAFAKLKAIK